MALLTFVVSRARVGRGNLNKITSPEISVRSGQTGIVVKSLMFSFFNGKGQKEESNKWIPLEFHVVNLFVLFSGHHVN